MGVLDDIRAKYKERGEICETCLNLVQVIPGVIGCEVHDRMILPMYPPYHDNMKCPDWKEKGYHGTNEDSGNLHL